MEYRAKIVGIALLCVAFGSEALTLGRVRGAALIGQPLDIMAQVQMDAGEDVSSLCFDAEVFHADTRQDGNRVRVVVEATAEPQIANVRVMSSALIDEPVVTVYLRTGCGQKTTRRYVLLADLPSEVAATSVPLIVPASAPPSSSLTSPVKADVPPKVPVSAALPFMASTPIPTAPVPVAKAKPVALPKQTVRQKVASNRPDVKAISASAKSLPSDEKNKAGRSAGQPRLKLNPLELLADRVTTLESSVPVAPSEDTLRDMRKMQTLEGDVKALLALAAKNEASLVDLKARLQKAESERFSNGLIYGLIALVLACLAALALLWRRQRHAQADGNDWWSGSVAAPAPAATEPPGLAPEPVATQEKLDEALTSRKARITALSELLDESGPSSEVDVSLVEMSESNFDKLMQSGTAHSAIRKQAPAPAVTPPMVRAHSLNAEAVIDVRQQAAFFVSLGQTDKAVQILERQIHESDAPNPLVYLDLLSLFHSLSLKIDFRQYREDFNQLFNGKVPDIALFKQEGKDLEAYPEVLSHITALWPMSKVLEVIEACIFRDPWDTKSEPFDLAAFRDLLLLHAVARSVVRTPSQESSQPKTGSSPGPMARANVPTFFADSGYAAPAPSKAPGRAVGVPADSPKVDIQLPGVLDLDLSDTEIVGLMPSSVPPAEVDFPVLMPEEHKAVDQTQGSAGAIDSGTLMKFDLPETPKSNSDQGPN